MNSFALVFLPCINLEMAHLLICPGTGNVIINQLRVSSY